MSAESVDVNSPLVSEDVNANDERACVLASEVSLNHQEPQKKLRPLRHTRCKKSCSHFRHSKGLATYFARLLKHVLSGFSLSWSTLSTLESLSWKCWSASPARPAAWPAITMAHPSDPETCRGLCTSCCPGRSASLLCTRPPGPSEGHTTANEPSLGVLSSQPQRLCSEPVLLP